MIDTTNFKENLDWLSGGALQLSTINPEMPLDELAPLKEIVGSARLIGMGEATHGSKELVLIRHRLFRFMVEQMHCKGLILETPREPAKDIDNYIKTGKGNAHDLLAQSGYWVHNTQEMLDVIEWMRQYNISNPDNLISFWGCDISVDDERRNAEINLRDEAMADACIDTLESLDTNTPIVLWSHNFHIRYSYPHKLASITTPQGEFLKQKLGSKYISLITLFNQGGFSAMNLDQKTDKIGPLKSFELPKAYKGTYEFELAKHKFMLAIYDVKQMRKLSNHGSYNYAVRETGSMFDPLWPKDRLGYEIDLLNACDGIIWVDTVTNTTLL